MNGSLLAGLVAAAAFGVVAVVLSRRNVPQDAPLADRVEGPAASAGDLVAEIDVEGMFRWASPSHVDVVGYLPRALCGGDASLLVHPEDREGLRRAVLSQGETGPDLEIEYRFRHRDGYYLQLESRFRALESESGRPAGFVVTSRDVTERRRTEDVLELLHETGKRALEREPADRALRYVCEELSRRIDAPLVWIGIKRPGGTVRLLAASGGSRSLLEAFELRWDEPFESLPLPCRALATGEVQVAEGLDGIPERYRALSRECGVGAVAACPLTRSGEVLGVLAVHAGSVAAIRGRSLSLLGQLADLVALALVEAEQRDAVEVRTAALESTANAVLILDPDGMILWTNAAFETLTGYPRGEVEGRPMSFLESDLHPPAFWDCLRETLSLGNVWRGEVFSRRKDRSVYVEQQTITPVRREDGSIRCFVAVRQDVTREQRARDRLRHLADHDLLTDLPNRQRIDAGIERLVSRAGRGTHAALLLADIDSFKLVNDAGGHLAGDRILVETARLLQSALRPGDELGRMGGNEFAVLLESADAEAARAAAERLRRTIEDHRFEVSGDRFDLSLTVGVGAVDGSLAAGEVLALTDAAVQAGKERGGNRVVVGEPSLLRGSSLNRASTWVARVKDALRSNRLVLHLQPIVHLASKRTVHHEVLLRMRDADGRLVGPGEFLPSAERFGLMPQVDRWVLARVLDLLEDRPELDLFMNVSGCSLADEALLDEMEGMVRARELAPGRLSFEITETAAVGDVAGAREWLLRLKEIGCRFALDDFGIGFSSFSYLQTLPVDYVKIDGSFIRSLEKERTNREIVTAIVAVAHSLGKQTIAEAVENQKTLRALRTLGVEYGQGWYLGRPEEPSRLSPAPPQITASVQEGVSFT